MVAQVTNEQTLLQRKDISEDGNRALAYKNEHQDRHSYSSLCYLELQKRSLLHFQAKTVLQQDFDSFQKSFLFIVGTMKTEQLNDNLCLIVLP